MKAEFKLKWIEALRSGEFSQERFGIGDKDAKRLCCLGIGAVAANPNVNLYDTESAVRELEKHGFINQFDEKKNFTAEASTLIELNDLKELSFAEIADWIEANISAE